MSTRNLVAKKSTHNLKTNENHKIILLSVCSCHVMYAFQSESTLYSCLNVKELLARNRCKIWSLSDVFWQKAKTLQLFSEISSPNKSVGFWVNLLWVLYFIIKWWKPANPSYMHIIFFTVFTKTVETLQ